MKFPTVHLLLQSYSNKHHRNSSPSMNTSDVRNTVDVIDDVMTETFISVCWATFVLVMTNVCVAVTREVAFPHVVTFWGSFWQKGIRGMKENKQKERREGRRREREGNYTYKHIYMIKIIYIIFIIYISYHIYDI